MNRGVSHKSKQFQWNGIFLGSIFFIGTLLRIFQQVFIHDRSLLYIATNAGTILMILATLGLFLSAFWKSATWFQPIMFLFLFPFPLIDNSESFFGLGFFTIGVLLLFRLGFFEHHRLLKLVLAMAYLYFWEIWCALRVGREPFQAFAPVFFITAFLIMLYFAFQEKLMVYLKEPKRKISLKEKALSEAEQAYVKATALAASCDIVD